MTTATPDAGYTAAQHHDDLQRRLVNTNPLIAALVAAGYELGHESVLSGSYYLLRDDSLLLIHPLTTNMAIPAFPVEVIA
jgi:hypothetical protein